ncbi:hypothetical protein AAC387_Pa09g0452 [Persea americana]
MLIDSIKSDWSSSEEKQTFENIASGCGLSKLGFSEISPVPDFQKLVFIPFAPLRVDCLTLGDEATIHGRLQHTPILPGSQFVTVAFFQCDRPSPPSYSLLNRSFPSHPPIATAMIAAPSQLQSAVSSPPPL